MSANGGPPRRLRLGMVGGGAGSLIGDSHRLAARLDDRFELVAGAFDIDPERGRRFAAGLRIAPERAYGTWREMVEAESARGDGCDLVTVATPNSTHFEIAGAFVDRGMNVLCEKPLTTSVDDARALVERVRARGTVFAVMYGYTGYPMVRQARAMVEAGELGEIRVVQTEFAHGHLAGPDEAGGGLGTWRLNPAVSGPSFVLGDIGTHALYMATFITGQRLTEVAAETRRFVPGRALEDDAHAMLRFDGGAVGALWASAVAAGSIHGHRIRVFGAKGGIEWRQEHPNQLHFTPVHGQARVLERDTPQLAPAARHRTRISAGHPTGYFEAWANVYSDVADAVAARLGGAAPPPEAMQFPTVLDGARGVAFVAAALDSARRNGAWTDATLAG